MSIIREPFEYFTLPLSRTTRVGGTFTYDTADESPAVEPTDANYIYAADFHMKHDKQINPPPGGWKNGSRIMCAMRQKNTGEYFPRVLCYVHIERVLGADDIYLIQKCCSGSLPIVFPAEYANKDYKSWTIRTGTRNFMIEECVAYLGPCEGRNAL